MAVKTIEPQFGSGLVHSVVTVLGSIAGLFGKTFASLAQAKHCSAEFDRLNMLSDDALAARGLNRQDLAHVVFEKYLKS